MQKILTQFFKTPNIMRVLLLSIIINIYLINSLNLNERANKIKDVLLKYKNNVRSKRDINETEMEIARNAMKFLKNTGRFKEFLEYYNVSVCPHSDNKNDSNYIKRHILHGLITDHAVPATHWREYKSVFNKSYLSSSHESSAQSAWQDNLEWVARHNLNYLKGSHTYALHLNPLGDLHSTEYIKKLLKLIKTIHLPDPFQDKRRRTFHRNMNKRVPKHVDWRELGYRPKREEQWHCGACYAFAVAHALQAQMFKKHRKWNELSPQQIVDCSVVDGNLGCEGGSLKATLSYAAREGLQSEIEYPYFGRKGRCRYNNRRIKVRPHRWAMLPAGNEWAIEKAVATIGPLAIGINAAPRSFQLYRSGVYDDPLCSPFIANHAMLLVGYTPEYWILLNWWGKRWGEDGYMRIRRGFNRCGVANMAAYVDIV